MHDVVDTGAMEVWLQDGVVRVRAKGIPSTADSVTRTFDAVVRVRGDKALPVLFDARAWPGGDTASWAMVVERLPMTFTAADMLLDPAAQPPLGRYPEVIDRLVIPFRTFEDEAEALQFLAEAPRVPD